MHTHTPKHTHTHAHTHTLTHTHTHTQASDELARVKEKAALEKARAAQEVPHVALLLSSLLSLHVRVCVHAFRDPDMCVSTHTQPHAGTGPRHPSIHPSIHTYIHT